MENVKNDIMTNGQQMKTKCKCGENISVNIDNSQVKEFIEILEFHCSELKEIIKRALRQYNPRDAITEINVRYILEEANLGKYNGDSFKKYRRSKKKFT